MKTLEQEPNIFDAYNPERRLYDDITTWLAETLDGQMRSSFDYRYDGKDLIAEDGSSIGEIFDKALNDAKNLPKELSFEQRRRKKEMDEYHDMLKMANGELPNTMVVVSDFPAELINREQDLGGYNVSRKQTMLRIISKKDDGSINIKTQSLDGSNRQALEGLYEHLGVAPAEDGELLGQRRFVQLDKFNQEFLADDLTAQYDKSLQEQTGEMHYAGVRGKKRVNTYDFVINQTDIIDLFMQDANTIYDNDELKYAIAAAIAERYQKEGSTNFNHVTYSEQESHEIISWQQNNMLVDEVWQSAERARAAGKVFSGCGGSLGGAKSELDKLGYGGKLDENGEYTDRDQYGPLDFVCNNGHSNRRPRGKLINCRVKNCKGASC